MNFLKFLNDIENHYHIDLLAFLVLRKVLDWYLYVLTNSRILNSKRRGFISKKKRKGI